jgi:hypothetical protein
MIHRIARSATIFALAVVHAGPTMAADALSKDLTSTLALLGVPCGKVVNAQRLGENDYLATCSNKMRYRVYMNAQGRVVAEKR